MSKAKLGHYVIGDSIIHLLDPRAKIIGSMFIVSSAIISSNFIVALINLCILILAIKLSGIDPLKFFYRMKSLLILFFFTFLFQAILTKGDVIFNTGRIGITKQGIFLGIVTILRLLTIYLCSTILTTTTSPMQLTFGLDSIFTPLKVLKVPVNQLSMIISISLRFIPTIIEEANNIKEAQKSRGAQFESPHLLVKLKSVTAVIIPIMAASLQRAGELATAMESRGYTAESRIRNTTEFHFKDKDIITVLIASTGLVLSFII